MLPLAQVPEYVRDVVPFYSLDGMTLLLGAFFLLCLAQPERVKSRTHFWAVFGCLLLIILLYVLRLMLYNSPAAQVFTGTFIGLTQAAGLVLTVLYVGGLRPGELRDELAAAAEDFRSGGQPRKPKIVPITGQMPKPRDEEPPAPPRIVIDLPKTDPDQRLPLE